MNLKPLSVWRGVFFISGGTGDGGRGTGDEGRGRGRGRGRSIWYLIHQNPFTQNNYL